MPSSQPAFAPVVCAPTCTSSNPNSNSNSSTSRKHQISVSAQRALTAAWLQHATGARCDDAAALAARVLCATTTLSNSKSVQTQLVQQHSDDAQSEIETLSRTNAPSKHTLPNAILRLVGLSPMSDHHSHSIHAEKRTAVEERSASQNEMRSVKDYHPSTLTRDLLEDPLTRSLYFKRYLEHARVFNKARKEIDENENASGENSLRRQRRRPERARDREQKRQRERDHVAEELLTRKTSALYKSLYPRAAECEQRQQQRQRQREKGRRGDSGSHRRQPRRQQQLQQQSDILKRLCDVAAVPHFLLNDASDEGLRILDQLRRTRRENQRQRERLSSPVHKLIAAFAFVVAMLNPLI